MSKTAKIFEHKVAGQWRVEWFDGPGRCELEIFSGCDAQLQALRCALVRFRRFQEARTRSIWE